MSCKKEKNNDSKERDQVKLKNEKNSDSTRKEISEKISNDPKNKDDRNLICTKFYKSKINRRIS